MGKRILLISPFSQNEALWITGTEGPEVKNNTPPLALVTIAALTPDGFTVDIWDEVVHGVIDDFTLLDAEYDLVGITGYKAHFQRARRLAEIFRKRNIPIAVGGPGVSATPDEYQDYFDILFIGEAEKTWPRFLEDWRQGKQKKEYRQIESIEMSESPVPDWELIADDIHKYSMGFIQTTRGCPFDCEFCDVVYLYGRRPRHKPKERVLEEVRLLERLGVRAIFICDDEFIGDPPYAKDLLRSLISLNREFRQPLTYSAQLTLRVSKDDELLELLADANFDVLFIGIETPNQESLKESSKLHNLSSNLIENIHKIQSYGVIVRSGIIVGFDHDDAGIFDMQYRFIQDSYIPSLAINMLKAPFGTRLWSRLRQDGRVVRITPEVRDKLGHPRSYTTIIPKQMTRVELMRGYRSLVERIFDWQNFGARVLGFIGNLKRTPAGMVGECEKNAFDLYPVKYGDCDEVRQIIQHILAEVAVKAPPMLPRIAALIVQHAKYREDILKLLPQIDRQIEREESGEIVFIEDKRAIPVPDSFRKTFREIFPEIFKKMERAVIDPGRVSEALVSVFVEFLIAYGHDYQRFSEEHLNFINTCVDHVASDINALKMEVLPVVRNISISGRAVGYLADDIMKNVNQILVNRTQ